MERKVDVVEDLEGNKIVVIHDIIFKGKRTMEGMLKTINCIYMIL